MSTTTDVYNLLLRALFIEYNTLLLRPVNAIAPANETNEDFVRRKKREREAEDDLDHSLQSIEDDILTIILLRRKKRKRNNDDNRTGKKRGKYNKGFVQYFTDPDTGVRTVMTPFHTVWYQCYIENPNPNSKKWQKLF